MTFDLLGRPGRGAPGMKRLKVRPRNWARKRRARQKATKMSRKRNRASYHKPKKRRKRRALQRHRGR